jgi:uncharacterized phage-associated protein
MLDQQQHRGGVAMPYDARAVANTILDIAAEQAVVLTHMALHKVCFYAHGWHLVRYGTPLIQQSFEAWENGPVLRSVWETLKTGRDKPVKRRATRYDPILNTHKLVDAMVSREDRLFLESIVASYGHIAGNELSEMTHAKGGPWDRVWNAPGGRVNLGMRIANDVIRDHFAAVTRKMVPS